MTALRERLGSWPRGASPRDVPGDHWWSSQKNLTDLVLASILMVWALPLIALSALAVRLTSRGPAIYSQTRVGRNGRTFVIYKIRSMRVDCEAKTGPIYSTGRGDSRVTPVGGFLRVTHLDELPQLWNVLRGDMSLVGPRPERPHFVESLSLEIPRYDERHGVRPGVTGLAQLQLPPDTGPDSVRKKLDYDLYYIANRTPWLDLRIILGTFIAMFGVPFEVAGPILRIPKPPTSGPGVGASSAPGEPSAAGAAYEPIDETPNVPETQCV